MKRALQKIGQERKPAGSHAGGAPGKPPLQLVCRWTMPEADEGETIGLEASITGGHVSEGTPIRLDVFDAAGTAGVGPTAILRGERAEVCVIAADGTERRVTLDESGTARIEKIAPGAVQLELVDGG